MNKEVTEAKTLENRLNELKPGERLVYGQINRLGVTLADLSVARFAQQLQEQGRIMCFQHKLGPHYGYELVAVGTTPKLNERFAEIIKRYEQKMGFKKKSSRNTN